MNNDLKKFKEHFGDATVENEYIVAEFNRFNEALGKFNINPDQRIILYRIIAGIMQLMDINFEDNATGCFISESSKETVQIASELLSVDSIDLIQNMTTKRMKILNRAGDVADDIK